MINRGFRQLIAILVVATLAFGSLVAPASAQAEAYTSQVTGLQITYASPYRFMAENSYADGQMEFAIFSGDADLAGIGFFPANIDLNAMRDSFLEGLFGEMNASHQIDRGDYDGVSYSLDMLQLDGYEMAVFTLFLNNRAHGFAEFQVYLAPPSLFTPLLTNAQASIAIGGVSFLQGIDADVMGQMVTANIGITGGATTTSVGDVQGETPQPDQDPTAAPTQGSVEADEDPRPYLTHVLTERSKFHDSVERFNTALAGLGEESTQEEKVAAINAITAEAQLWQGYTATAQAITPPAGLEGLHTTYLDWSAEITTLGTMWVDVQNGTVTTQAFFDQFNVALTKDAEFGDGLVDAAATLDSDESAQEPTAAPTEVATDTSADATVYFATVVRHRNELHASVDRVNTELSALERDSPQEVVNTAFANVTADAQTWQGYTDTALAVVPPPGQEALHAIYLEWAAEVTTLGDMWVDLMGGGPTTSEQFFAQLNVVAAKDTELGEALVEAVSAGASDSEDTGNQATEVAETTEATEAAGNPPVRTRRTSAPSEPTAESTEPAAPDVDTTTRRPRTLTKTESNPAEEENTSETARKSVREGTRVERTGTATTTAESPGSWQPPQSEAEVAWPAVFSQFDVEDAADDQLFLAHDDGAIVSLSVQESVSASPADLVGTFAATSSGQTGVEAFFGDTAVLVWSEDDVDASSALVRVGADATEYEWIYVQFTCTNDDCSQLVTVIIRGDAESLLTAVDAANEGLRANDISVTDVSDLADIESGILDSND